MLKPIWRREQVEDLALITLLDFRRQTGLRLAPPLDVDLVGEITCGLHWDWDILPEPAGTVIWAALFPDQHTVVLNETHREKFIEKSGLERFTKAHEIGHWVLHVHDAGVNSGQMFCRGGETQTVNWIEKHADWFAGALLMPASVFVPIAEHYDLTEWRSLYELARLFDVTISALCVRLAHLGLSYVDEQGQIHASLAARKQPAWPGPTVPTERATAPERMAALPRSTTATVLPRLAVMAKRQRQTPGLPRTGRR